MGCNYPLINRRKAVITSFIAAATVLYALKTANEIMLRYIFPDEDFLPSPPPATSTPDHQP
jgi:hypothetical protein